MAICPCVVDSKRQRRYPFSLEITAASVTTVIAAAITAAIITAAITTTIAVVGAVLCEGVLALCTDSCRGHELLTIALVVGMLLVVIDGILQEHATNKTCSKSQCRAAGGP